MGVISSPAAQKWRWCWKVLERGCHKNCPTLQIVKTKNIAASKLHEKTIDVV